MMYDYGCMQSRCHRIPKSYAANGLEHCGEPERSKDKRKSALDKDV